MVDFRKDIVDKVLSGRGTHPSHVSAYPAGNIWKLKQNLIPKEIWLLSVGYGVIYSFSSSEKAHDCCLLRGLEPMKIVFVSSSDIEKKSLSGKRPTLVILDELDD